MLIPVLSAIPPSRSYLPAWYTRSNHKSCIRPEFRAVTFSVAIPVDGHPCNGGRRFRLRATAANDEPSAVVCVGPTQNCCESPTEKNIGAAACSTSSGLLQATGIVLSAILLCCPPSGASDLVEAQKAFGDAGRQIEQVVVQALNWPYGEATSHAQRKAGAFLDFRTWHLPTSPSQIFSGLPSRDSNQQEGTSPRQVKAKTDASTAEKGKDRQEREKQDREEKEKAKREKEKKDEAKAKAAKEEKQRQLEKERRRREREIRELERKLAVYGGGAVGLGVLGFAKWQTIVTVFAVLFRSLGGPSIISGILGTPGYIFGKQIRAVEWDVAASPGSPNGRVVSFKLRAFTAEGIRKAIATRMRLERSDEVKQVFHWIQSGPNFYEPLRTPMSFRMMPDPAWVVWSRHPRSGEHRIPARGDEQQLLASANSLLGGLSKDEEVVLMLRCISATAAVSRETAPPVATSLSNGSLQIASMGNALSPPPLGVPEVGVVVDLPPRTWFGGPQTGTNGSHVAHMSNGSSSSSSSAASPSSSAVSTASSPYADTFPPPSLAASCIGQGHQPAHAATRAYSLNRPSPPRDEGDPPDLLQHRLPCTCGDADGRGSAIESGARPVEPSRRSEGGTAAKAGAASVPTSDLVTMSLDGEDEAPPPITLNGKPVTLRSAFWALLGVTEPRPFRRGDGLPPHAEGNPPSYSTASTSGMKGGMEGMQLTRSRRYQARRRGVPQDARGKQFLGGHRGTSEPAAGPSMLASSTDEGSAGYRGVASTLDRLMKRLTLPSGFLPITDAEEEILVARAAASPEAYLALFRAYGAKDPATFVRYARVLCHEGKQA